MIDVDIPQLSSDGIKFGGYCFYYTYSLQSSSTHPLISSSFDATGLENYINFGTMEPSASSTVIRNRTEFNSIPLDVDDLWIGRFDTSDVSEYLPSRFQSLKTLVIGNGCFGNVRVFELDGLGELESVVIGQKSFRIDYKERNDGSYRIMNCPKLKSIQIGDGSFSDYHSIELNNLPSLQSIIIGNDCFGNVRVFELNGLGELESVVIGERSFMISSEERRDGSCRIVNCPKLKSIQIGDKSFSDYHSFELNNLPSLQSIDIGAWCFFYAPSFSLTGLIDVLV